MDEARRHKLQKAHGTQIICPKCGNAEGPFNPDFASDPVVWTCPKCSCKFDSDGSTGPFTVTCSDCGEEQPFTNQRCFMCRGSLKAEKLALQKPAKIRCSNCGEMNHGAGRCIRCGQHITASGNVIRVN